MRRLLTLALTMLGASAAAPLEAAESASSQAAEPKPGLVTLDFRSTFDGGVLGAKVAEIINGHAARSGKFQTYDVSSRDEVLTYLRLRAEPETAAEQIARAGREGFGATYVFWGEVKPARAGYIVRFKAVDCRGEPAKLVIDEERSAENVHAIPLLVDEVLRQLTGEPAPVVAPDPAAERAWQANPSLLANGSFEKGSDHPTGWDALPDYAHWAPNPDGGGRCLRFDLDRQRAESYGGLLHSDYIPLRPGATYRFQVRVKSLGPTPKVFLKGYDEFPATFGFAAQPREVYRRDINGTPTGDWVTYSGDFTPHSATYTPKSLRVILYAYLKPGAIYFDDCVLKEIRPPQGRSSKENAGDVSTAPH